MQMGILLPKYRHRHEASIVRYWGSSRIYSLALIAS